MRPPPPLGGSVYSARPNRKSAGQLAGRIDSMYGDSSIGCSRCSKIRRPLSRPGLQPGRPARRPHSPHPLRRWRPEPCPRPPATESAPAERSAIGSGGSLSLRGRATSHLPGDSAGIRAVAESEAERATDRQTVPGARASGRRVETAFSSLLPTQLLSFSVFSCKQMFAPQTRSSIQLATFQHILCIQSASFLCVPQGSRFDHLTRLITAMRRRDVVHRPT